jgi:2-polyprenyl-3-methyl-5-hydroxy-6-metoxy-1,4-benzoquinol methylase
MTMCSHEGPSFSCPVCGSSRCECVIQNCDNRGEDGCGEHGWTCSLMRCDDCGLGFITPVPGSDMIPSLYPSSYDCYRCIERFRWLQQIWWKTVKWRYSRVYCDSVSNRFFATIGRAVCNVVGREPPATIGVPLSLPISARILEVGFGSGDWLLKMRRCGYIHLSGIDIAANEGNCVRMANEGIDVCSGDITTKGSWPGPVDCVRMEHVLEHVPNPKPLLEHLSKLLLPSGWLVLTVPDFGWWCANRTQIGQPWLDLPRHIYHYTVKSLSELLADARFSVIYMESIRFGKHRFPVNPGDVRVQRRETGCEVEGPLFCDGQAPKQSDKGEQYITVCARCIG